MCVSVDEKDRKVKAKQITYHRRHNLQYFDVSAKSNYQFEKPFLWLARRLSGDPQLTIVEAPILAAGEIVIDEAQMAEIRKEEQEMELLKNAPLPDDEDPDLQ